jgi:SAM-dependent methyltransferase
LSTVSAQSAYLEGALRRSFDAWLDAAVARYQPPLRPSEIGRGLRALSSLYVERRGGSDLGRRSREGVAKRAAFATYFAPMHFLTTWHALGQLEPPLASVKRVVDLGCGTGAVGAAAALACPDTPRLLGVDASGWALGEARHTWDAFGLQARAVRRRLPSRQPELRAGDLAVLGWFVNELDTVARERLLATLVRARRRGAGVLLLEPLARRVAPWWEEGVRGLGADTQDHELHIACERPERVADLDVASGLDHRVLGARVCLAAPDAAHLPRGPSS